MVAFLAVPVAFLLLVRPTHAVGGNIYCTEDWSCAHTVIDCEYYCHIRCHGDYSCYNTTFTYVETSKIECWGASSCAQTTMTFDRGMHNIECRYVDLTSSLHTPGHTQ